MYSCGLGGKRSMIVLFSLFSFFLRMCCESGVVVLLAR